MKIKVIRCLLPFIFCLPLIAQNKIKKLNSIKNETSQKMKIEIWSDVVCPFCYIGKRNLEEAISKIDGKENIEIIWKSFQLDPTSKNIPGKSYLESLAEKKGWTMEYTKETVEYVEHMALGAGLHLNFNNAVSANTFDAHRLIHFAQKYNKGGLAKEKLLSAHFIEGKNVEDISVLIQIAVEIGLDKETTKSVLLSNEESENVKSDINEARALKISGVPFFVFDRKYAVSGAQPSKVFVDTITKALKEWQINNPTKFTLSNAESNDATCLPNGECIPDKK